MQIDVCNGAADGLCSVVQWRLHAPGQAQLVTGLKQDRALLSQVQARAGDEVLVCAVSMDDKLQEVQRLLAAGAQVRYFGRHGGAALPLHPALEAHLDLSGKSCSSLLVDRRLRGRFRVWALVGAFGAGLTDRTEQLARKMGLSGADMQRLRRFGEAINYNAGGESLQDVPVPPEQLFHTMLQFPDPLELLDRTDIGLQLDALRRLDLQRAMAVAPYSDSTHSSVYVLPDLAWSRRVTGSWMKLLASGFPRRAHTVLRVRANGDYVVRVRAPLDTPRGAGPLCRAFGGDGSAAAAGIDRLPAARVTPFLEALSATDWRAAPGACPA